MAISGDSSEDEDVARLPTQQRTNKTPLRKAGQIPKGNKKSNPKNDGGRNDRPSAGDGGESNPTGAKKTREKADDAKDKMVLTVGRKAAKGFLHNTTMFPTDDCFIPNDEENSFSSLLKETFHDDSICKDNKEFLMLLSSNRSAWYTCCLLYTSPSPRDLSTSRMPSSA